MPVKVYRSFSELKVLTPLATRPGKSQNRAPRSVDCVREMLTGLEEFLQLPTDAELAAEVAAQISSEFLSSSSSRCRQHSSSVRQFASASSGVTFKRQEYNRASDFADSSFTDSFSRVDRWLCHCQQCLSVGVSVLNTMRCRQLMDPVERTIESHFLSELYCVAAYRWARDQNYFNSFSRLIRLMKAEPVEHLPILFGRLVADALQSDMPEVLEYSDMLIPVPADPVRAAFRGFDNVEAIAEWVSEFSHIPLNTTSLEKPSPTLDLRRVPFEQRAEVVRGAFTVTDAAAIRGKRILLFDDVVTSGSTLNECAEVLLDHGANSVIAVALGMSERTTYIAEDDDDDGRD